MILAFCVDDQGGLAFNHRRQSRDFACLILPGFLTRER